MYSTFWWYSLTVRKARSKKRPWRLGRPHGDEAQAVAKKRPPETRQATSVQDRVPDHPMRAADLKSGGPPYLPLLGPTRFSVPVHFRTDQPEGPALEQKPQISKSATSSLP